MLPILPMGTIVTVCMLIGLLVATPYALNKRLKPLPRLVAIIIGSAVLLGGAWNTFWHGIQNLTNSWGLAALFSGLFMMLTGLYILRFDALPSLLQKIRSLVLLGLLGWFLVYAIKIASL
ncbi:MAG: hypothetical protein KTR35_09500 [Gammaproteobacteria bacterium]|nr:hypothetical protein [Gammaproteobacteria bacterium]